MPHAADTLPFHLPCDNNSLAGQINTIGTLGTSPNERLPLNRCLVRLDVFLIPGPIEKHTNRATSDEQKAQDGFGKDGYNRQMVSSLTTHGYRYGSTNQLVLQSIQRWMDSSAQLG